MQFVLGIDEAGRGPIAGPVAVGIVAVPEGFDVLTEFPGVKDSKKLTPKKREALFDVLKERERVGDVRFSVELESASAIDAKGIVPALRRALKRGLDSLAPDASIARLQLDGALHGPPEYDQETIIRGDDTVPLISLASIAAKVVRDRWMREAAEKYPEYAFEKHKGYGTREHYALIEEHGLCILHRRSFIHIDETN